MKVFIESKYWCSCHNAFHPHEGRGKKESCKQGNFRTYKVKNYEHCCVEMEEAIENYFICFGNYDDSILNNNKSLNIIKCYPWPEGAAFSEMRIKFCPFCKDEITIVE